MASGGVALAGQRALGREWRTSVAGTEAGELVTRGPYRYVRHPNYTAFMGVLLANVVAAPDAGSIGGGMLAAVALALQARWVEEPALTRTHGSRYEMYATGTGRFLPRLLPR